MDWFAHFLRGECARMLRDYRRMAGDYWRGQVSGLRHVARLLTHQRNTERRRRVA